MGHNYLAFASLSLSLSQPRIPASAGTIRALSVLYSCFNFRMAQLLARVDETAPLAGAGHTEKTSLCAGTSGFRIHRLTDARGVPGGQLQPPLRSFIDGHLAKATLKRWLPWLTDEPSSTKAMASSSQGLGLEYKVRGAVFSLS